MTHLLGTLTARLGLQPQTVSGWVKAGLVTPEVRHGGRLGYEVGPRGLLELIATAKLREVGFSARRIQRVIEALRVTELDPCRALLVLEGERIGWIERSPGRVVLHLPMGGCAMVFDFGTVYREVCGDD